MSAARHSISRAIHLTLRGPRLTLGLEKTIELVRGDWKAVKIGHGPATVIGRRGGRRAPDVLCGFRTRAESQDNPELVEAVGLREKGQRREASSLFARLFCFECDMEKSWRDDPVAKCGKFLRCFVIAVLAVLALGTTSNARDRHRRSLALTVRADGLAPQVVDEVGRHVNMPAQVSRVVTLSPDLTETIYALGLEDKLAGDTNYCDTPPAAKLKPHIGTAQNPSLEAIVALRPDLVLASTSINRQRNRGRAGRDSGWRCIRPIRTRCAECLTQ